MNPESTWLSTLAFNQDGLIPAIAQDAQSGAVLMMAWMNAEAVSETVRTGHAVYYSRSRQRLWRKGEESGHIQIVQEIRLDCDGDVLLLKITQHGGIACHTGRAHCFFRRLDTRPEGTDWVIVDPILQDPTDIYSSSKP